MNQDRVTAFVKAMNLKFKPATPPSKWFKIECPFAPWTHEKGTDKNPSFGITVNNGPSHYNCFACGKKGLLMDLPLELHKYSKDKKTFNGMFEYVKLYDCEDVDITKFVPLDFGFAPRTTPQQDFHPWPEEFLKQFSPVISSYDALKYLQNRGLDASTIKALGIVFDKRQRRVCFPYRDNNGILAGVVGRAIDSDNPLRYRAYKYNDTTNPHIWINQNNVDPNKPLVIVESVFDMASVHRVYQNVICSRCATIPESMLHSLPEATAFITVYDNDAAGDCAREWFKKKVPSYKLIQLKPSNGKKDPGEMTLHEIKDMFKTLLFITNY